MRQYNSLHFTIVEPKNRPSKPDLFLANILQLYPSLQTALDAKLATIEINGESLFLACTFNKKPSFHFRYTIYWAVASLSSVRKLVDDLKRLAIRANLIWVQLPAELLRPFENAISPLFYSREVVISHDSNMDYFCHLMDMLLYRVSECEGGYIGYTDGGMKDFAQVNHGERSIRVIENNYTNSLVQRINELLSISECVNTMMQKLYLCLFNKYIMSQKSNIVLVDLQRFGEHYLSSSYHQSQKESLLESNDFHIRDIYSRDFVTRNCLEWDTSDRFDSPSWLQDRPHQESV